MIEYELFHLNNDNRISGRYLEVLHPDFKEFGQSGKMFVLEDFKEMEFGISKLEIINLMYVNYPIVVGYVLILY